MGLPREHMKMRYYINGNIVHGDDKFCF